MLGPSRPVPRVGARARIAHFGGSFERGTIIAVSEEGRRLRVRGERARRWSSSSAPPPRASSRPAWCTAHAWSCWAIRPELRSGYVGEVLGAVLAQHVPIQARSAGLAARKRASSSRWPSIGAPAIVQLTASRSNSSSTARCQASSVVDAAARPVPASVSAYSRRVAGRERAAQRQRVALGVGVVAVRGRQLRRGRAPALRCPAAAAPSHAATALRPRWRGRRWDSPAPRRPSAAARARRR